MPRFMPPGKLGATFGNVWVLLVVTPPVVIWLLMVRFFGAVLFWAKTRLMERRLLVALTLPLPRWDLVF